MLIQPFGLSSEGRLALALGLTEGEVTRLAATAGRFYEPFLVQGGAKPRLIDRPIDPLKSIQRRIDRALLRKLAYPPHLHGGIRDRSSKSNAVVHLGKPCVVRIDVQKYFPSIRYQQIYEVWRTVLGCSPDISRSLTQLTTWRGRIPQGASTSMSLANLVLLGADEEILAVAARNDLRYTRYVDDLVFSGDGPRSVIQAVIAILKGYGFRVSREKIEVMGRGKRQHVTGHSVNRSDRVTKGGTYRDKIRAAIFQLRPLSDQPHLFEISLRSIRGRLEHLRTINPESAATLDGKLAVVLADRSSMRRSSTKPRRKPRRGVSVAKWRRSLAT